jgi:branched-chain amino acid transport system permease protein
VLVLQVIVNGILLGGLYACVSIGFSIIWGVMNLINLAHGSMIVLGAYITFLITTYAGIDPFATIPVSAAALFLLGYLLQKYLINLVVQVSIFITLIFTFGLDMVLVNVNVALFTADIRSLNLPYAQLVLDIMGIGIPYGQLCVFTAAVVLTLGLHAFLNHTRIGAAIKATSFDREAASLTGVDIKQIYALTFAIGSMMAGVAGSLTTVVFSFSPVSGDSYTMKSIVVVVLGGLGSVPGAIFGGVVLGVVENLASLPIDCGIPRRHRLRPAYSGPAGPPPGQGGGRALR